MVNRTQGRIYATGKRKSAIARIYMAPGTGKILVNDRDLETYFGRPTLRMVLKQPLEMVDALEKWDIKCLDIIIVDKIGLDIHLDIRIFPFPLRCSRGILNVGR